MVIDSSLKTRFCPSPTGLMHLGNARTALFNALLAKHAAGCFLLRIEDTDRERSDPRYTELLQTDLQWLGLQWQEGPHIEGQSGPYFQSQRQAIYDDYYKRLEKAGFAYPCFCSEEQLALTRRIQRASGRPPRYPGTCRQLTEDSIAEKMAQGLQATLRFRVPEDEVIEFDDLVRGKQRFQTNDIGDFIIRRTDGTAPFMYCNAIDDSLMGVSHALRGEDHLTNTPRQIMILQVLGLAIPTYGHIALIVGSDGSPLSKRHGSRSIDELRKEGYLPGAVNNYLARLGHYYGHDNYLNFAALAREFKIEALAKSPARFNPSQLIYWQKEAIARLDLTEVWTWLGEAVRSQVPKKHQQNFIELIKPNITFPKDAANWVQVCFGEDIAMPEDNISILKKAGADYFKVALNAFTENGADIQAITQHIKEVLGVKGKDLYMPLRIALTGQQHGPELGKIIAMMEPSKVRRRLEMAL